jgi:hypothetical protein
MGLKLCRRYIISWAEFLEEVFKRSAFFAGKTFEDQKNVTVAVKSTRLDV